MADQLVSICTATFNRAHLIHLAIESALHQTYQNWEMIISDDGSEDDTKEVVESYKDKRIKYINEGKSDYYTINRNRALKASKGSLFVFFDDDSVHHPQFIEEHLVRHQTEDVVLTYSGRIAHMHLDPAEYKYEEIGSLPGKAIPLIPYDGTTEELNGVLDVGDYMIKRKVYDDLGGFNEEKDLPSYCSDMELVDRILKNYPNDKIVMIPKRLHHNFMYGYDHMTKRKLDARNEGKMVDEMSWKW